MAAWAVDREFVHIVGPAGAPFGVHVERLGSQGSIWESHCKAGRIWGPRQHVCMQNNTQICVSGARDGSDGSDRSDRSDRSGVKNGGSNPTSHARRGPG